MNAKILSILKQARINKKYTQSYVAEHLGVKGNTIGNYENGNTEPDIDTFIKLCNLYEIDFAEILEDAYGSINNDIEKLSVEESKIIKKYRVLDERGKENVIATLNREYKHSLENGENPSENKVG